VVQIGVSASAGLPALTGLVIVCGLAGALAPELKPGAVVIPEWVGLPSGEQLTCYPPLVAALVQATRHLGTEPVTAPLLTAPSLVTGSARADWAIRGFVAADMESALILRQFPETAVVRVILDTPESELAADWEHPMRALLTPRLWPAAAHLAIDAPRATLRAAAVISATHLV
jgi:nucleoside phosphorylase